MALVKGTNCGFVTEAPVDDPAAGAGSFDTRAVAFKVTAPATAVKVTEIGWWCDAISEEANYEVGIYDHNVGDDNPENLIGSSTVNAKGTTAGWKKVTGLDIDINAEEIYWIAVQLDDTPTATTLNETADAGEKQDVKTVETELTDPWAVSSGTYGHMTGFYAVWTAAAASEGKDHGNLNKPGPDAKETPGIF